MLIALSVNSATAASSPLQYRTFINGSALWISEPAGITLYRNDTRSVRNVVLCDTADNDSIRDIAENSSALWVLAASGAYQIDLTTTTVEKLPGNKKGSTTGRLAVDDDYLWLGISDTLWRFDKLGREWFPYPIKSGNNELCGMYSDGTNVYCVQSTSIKIFSSQDEKWREFPYPKDVVISPTAQFFLDKNALVLVEGASIYRYIIDAQSWDVINAPSPVIDMLSQDTAIFYLTSSGAFQYFTKTSVTRPLDIPGIADVRCFTRSADTLYCATQKNYIKYDFNGKTGDFIQAPQNVTDFSVGKTTMFRDTVVAVCPGVIAACDTKSRLWESVGLSAARKKHSAFVWDDNNGAKLSISKGDYSQLRGSVTQNMFLSDSAAADLSYSMPVTLAGLTLHSRFPDGGYADLFFNNTDRDRTPKKGLLYRGAAGGYVETARLGTVLMDVPQSNTILRPQFEGGNVILQSASSLATRDRRVVKGQAGGGLLTTRTIYEQLHYSESEFYLLKAFKADGRTEEEIVPGSSTVMIDGEMIDSADYSFTAASGSLKFNRHDLLDPSSLITVSYQVRAVPPLQGGQRPGDVVEFVPENNFGRLGYGSVTVSPTNWISPQAGFVHLTGDSATHGIINASAPTEIRTGSSSLFLKFNPEITYDAATRAKAAALSLQGRFGEKLSVQFNGLVPDSTYISTDNFDRGYGFIRHNADFTAGYDIRKEFPLSYYQHDIVSAHGTERRYAVNAGSHFQGFPFLDVSFSRNAVTTDRNDTMRVTHTFIDSVWDSVALHYDTVTRTDTSNSVVYALDRIKDKFRVRLYETSSPILERLLHLSRFNYDMSYTGFSSRREGLAGTGYGSIFYGRGTVSPIKRLTFTLQGTYLGNAPGSLYASEYNPSFILQTIDAPPGFDLSARNELTFKSIAGADSSFSNLRRSLVITIKPGAWRPSFSWIQPTLLFNQQLDCGFHGYAPGVPALLIPDDNVVRRNTTRGFGANVFPTNNITFQNDNRFTTADSSTLWHLFNDLKWWFSDKQFWQTRWEYDRTRPRFGPRRGLDYNHGSTRYTNTWTPWLQTLAGISAGFTRGDSLGSPVWDSTAGDSVRPVINTSETKFGPDITVSINTQKFFLVRSLLMNHTASVIWKKNNSGFAASPDIAYSLVLRVVVVPNISFMATNSFSFERSRFTRYNGQLSASAIF